MNRKNIKNVIYVHRFQFLNFTFSFGIWNDFLNWCLFWLAVVVFSEFCLLQKFLFFLLGLDPGFFFFHLEFRFLVAAETHALSKGHPILVNALGGVVGSSIVMVAVVAHALGIVFFMYVWTFIDFVNSAAKSCWLLHLLILFLSLTCRWQILFFIIFCLVL